MPAPRRTSERPYLRITGPTVWTTLALTIRADGSNELEVVGASPFPRHWVYDQSRRLAAKTGLIDFRAWYERASVDHSPRFQGGRRTATLRALTPCRVAVVPGDRIDPAALREVARGRLPDPG